MKKDTLIKIVFILLIVVCIYFIISGLSSTTEGPGEILEQGLQLSTTSVNLDVDGEFQVIANVVPSDATYQNVEWRSSNPSIATVDNGIIHGVSTGNCIIQASTEKMKITRVVTVTVGATVSNVEKIIVTNPTIELNIGESAKIEYSIEPADATNKNISFVSENPDIVAFNAEKEIVGVSAGEGTIVLKSSNGVEERIKVTVKQGNIEVSGVYLDMKLITVMEGADRTLNVTIRPSNASNQTITWTSSDNNIATVDNGKVTGVKEGTATITAKSNNGKEASCTVNVKPKEVIYPALTDNPKYHSGYSLVDSCNSDTMKFRIQSKSGGEFVLIWVKDPVKQWNSALPQLGRAFNGENLINSEINNYGYQDKCLVATNASFFWAGWGESPGIPFLINKGKIIRDIENKKYPTIYGCLSMTKDGNLKTYSFSNDYAKNQASKQEMLNDGVRNNFAYATMPINEEGVVTSSNDRNNRTVLCQIDRNNFVIYSGGALTFNQIGAELKNHFGCKVAYNLDGGGSRKLYYKTTSMSSARRVFGGSRAIPDMMYFVGQ